MRMKSVLLTASIALLAGNGLAAAEDLRFALVPKFIGNPFYDAAGAGCETAAKEIGGIECIYIGPAEHGDGSEQVRMVQDLITQGVDGIAVAVANAPAMARALESAKEAGVEAITFDGDVLEKDKGVRSSYVGTKNYDIGANLAKIAMELKPNGGTVCLQAGSPTAANHQERLQGIRDTLAGISGTTPPGERLTGQNGWTEADGCPHFDDDDTAKAVQGLSDILNKYADLDAFISTGAPTQWADNAYRQAVEPFLDKLESKELVILVADTLPVQMQQLKDGYSNGQVGQRPYEMGYRSMYVLKELVDGKSVQDPLYTGLDVCTESNADSCITE